MKKLHCFFICHGTWEIRDYNGIILLIVNCVRAQMGRKHENLNTGEKGDRKRNVGICKLILLVNKVLK